MIDDLKKNQIKDDLKKKIKIEGDLKFFFKKLRRPQKN
jgi:hypothetical protein